MVPAVSDIRVSSLSFIRNGRVQIRVPEDNVKLLMHGGLEPGIMCVERNAGGRDGFGYDAGVDGDVEDGEGGRKEDWRSTADEVLRTVALEDEKRFVRKARQRRKKATPSSSQHPTVNGSRHDRQLDAHESYESSSSCDHDLSILQSFSTENLSYSEGLWEEERFQSLTAHQPHRSLYPKPPSPHTTSERKRRPHRQRRRRGRIPDLNYVLTVDQDLYRRVLKEMSDSRSPCGLYYCCHEASGETKHVHIGVAIGLLSVVLTLMFIATCYWPWL